MKRLAPLLLLAACATTDAPAPEPFFPPPGTDTCGAAGLEQLVGQDATALEKVYILGQVRVIRPGTAVTMDYRAERLNFQIDSAGKIARIYCG